MSHATHYYAMQMQALRSFGIITHVSPEVLLEILNKQEKPLILESLGGFIFRKHYRYLTSYKGLAFFTKSHNPIAIPKTAEVINVKYLNIPFEGFKIY